MYFPKRFNRKLSAELVSLIEKAYEQFDSFENSMKEDLPLLKSLMKNII